MGIFSFTHGLISKHSRTLNFKKASAKTEEHMNKQEYTKKEK